MIGSLPLRSLVKINEALGRAGTGGTAPVSPGVLADKADRGVPAPAVAEPVKAELALPVAEAAREDLAGAASDAGDE